MMYREGTGGTGGVSHPGLCGETIPSAVDGRIFELPGEVLREWNSPPCVRIGVVGETVVDSDVPGMRIAGSDFLRVGRVSEDTSGGETREGDEGAVGIGCSGGAGVTMGSDIGAGADTCESPNPGGSAGSEKSDAAPPLVSGFVALTGVSETMASGTAGGAGGLRPNEARSRSTA